MKRYNIYEGVYRCGWWKEVNEDEFNSFSKELTEEGKNKLTKVYDDGIEKIESPIQIIELFKKSVKEGWTIKTICDNIPCAGRFEHIVIPENFDINTPIQYTFNKYQSLSSYTGGSKEDFKLSYFDYYKIENIYNSPKLTLYNSKKNKKIFKFI